MGRGRRWEGVAVGVGRGGGWNGWGRFGAGSLLDFGVGSVRGV